MFYFYVFSAQRILQRTPCEQKRSIMHAIKYVYLCLCLFDWSTLIFLFSPPNDLQRKLKRPIFLTRNCAWRCLGCAMLTNLTHGWLPVWHHTRKISFPSPACQPINTAHHLLPNLQGYFLWHLGVSKSFYSEAFWLSHSWLMILYYTLNWHRE